MERGVLTHIAANDPGLLRLTPPYTVCKDDVALLLNALEDTLMELKLGH
jgi:hypothetical protein